MLEKKQIYKHKHTHLTHKVIAVEGEKVRYCTLNSANIQETSKDSFLKDRVLLPAQAIEQPTILKDTGYPAVAQGGFGYARN